MVPAVSMSGSPNAAPERRPAPRRRSTRTQARRVPLAQPVPSGQRHRPGDATGSGLAANPARYVGHDWKRPGPTHPPDPVPPRDTRPRHSRPVLFLCTVLASTARPDELQQQQARRATRPAYDRIWITTAAESPLRQALTGASMICSTRASHHPKRTAPRPRQP